MTASWIAFAPEFCRLVTDARAAVSTLSTTGNATTEALLGAAAYWNSAGLALTLSALLERHAGARVRELRGADWSVAAAALLTLLLSVASALAALEAVGRTAAILP